MPHKKIAIKFDCFFNYWHTAKSIFCGVRLKKISATVKNSGKKFTKITPCGPALQLHRADYAMVYGGNLRSPRHFRSAGEFFRLVVKGRTARSARLFEIG